ncbi:MAG: CPBP family intramembrane metalloprotease [Lachnospiraceae bacterium]|nr:CPBP family intramembrane metalloprotease [Lachnospiraceae bacterium]
MNLDLKRKLLIFRRDAGEEELTSQQLIYGALRDLAYAIRPTLTYILCTMTLLFLGFLMVGLGFGVEEYVNRFGNFFVTLGTFLTFHRLFSKSKKAGHTFFEDASLYHENLSFKKTVGAWIFGIGASLAVSAVISLLPRVGAVGVYADKVSNIYKQWDVFLSLAASVLFTPLVEEIIFRGYMLNRLLVKWDERAAMIATTLIFAILHGSSIWFIYTFFMGWVIGRLSIREDNIFYGIFMHSGFNLTSTVLWLIYINYPGSQEALAGNKFLIFLLGLMGGLAAFLMWRLYKNSTGAGSAITGKTV